MARIEEGPTKSVKRPKGPPPTAEEIFRMMDEAGRELWLIAELKRLADWREGSARVDRLYGKGTSHEIASQIDRGMITFREEAKNYDLLPDKVVILGRQAPLGRTAPTALPPPPPPGLPPPRVFPPPPPPPRAREKSEGGGGARGGGGRETAVGA